MNQVIQFNKEPEQGTIDDHYDGFSDEAKIQVMIHRTILAFDSEFSKPKNVLKIEAKIKESSK